MAGTGTNIATTSDYVYEFRHLVDSQVAFNVLKKYAISIFRPELAVFGSTGNTYG
jgi:hypothetical protein